MAKSKKRAARKPKEPEIRNPMEKPNDYMSVGPTDIDGVEASDLPDHGRGPVETNIGKELRRKPPMRTGEWETGETGLRGDPEVADAADHGGRKRS